MYPALNRLRKTSDIEKLFKNGKSFLTALFSLKLAKNNFKETRFAVVVGTKVHKRAVRRNLIKRRIRAALIELIPGIKSGFDVVISARTASLDKTAAQIKQELVSAFQRTGLL